MSSQPPFPFPWIKKTEIVIIFALAAWGYYMAREIDPSVWKFLKPAEGGQK